MDFIGLVSGYVKYSELDLNGNYEGWTLLSPLSMAWWVSSHIIDETKVLILRVEVLYLKWDDVGWLFHYNVG